MLPGQAHGNTVICGGILIHPGWLERCVRILNAVHYANRGEDAAPTDFFEERDVRGCDPLLQTIASPCPSRMR